MDNDQRVKNQENGDYFTNLPSEIIIDILSRLPIRTIIACKVVCKSWCNFVTSLEFAKSHLSRSVPGLAVSQILGNNYPRYKVFEFVDEISPCFRRNFNFKFPHVVEIRTSFDGLLVLGDYGRTCYYICNPVTREYIKLPRPPSQSGIDMIGFGVSKITGQYKLARFTPPNSKSPECEIYTLGTGSWRTIAADCDLKYYKRQYACVVVKGILLWLAEDSNEHLGISCIDLETELFSSFSIPGLQSPFSLARLTMLRDCLWLCDYSPNEGTNIWSMKEYRDDRVWTKEFVFKKCGMIPLSITDIRVLIDGDILMASKHEPELVRFSPKSKTTRTIRLAGLDTDTDTDTFPVDVSTTNVVYTPGFLPVLKTLVMEDVTSF